ncbi:neuron navigator 2 [Aplysia californica]|uniref:Neuron navigator 2 n=1 Tax=Aplysia californica TaxID=6500 RepID=A0ABM1AF26_APLCA|nr:neuron navigator 2 [Aplysia californica]
MDTHPTNLAAAAAQSGRCSKQMLPQSPMMSPNLGRHPNGQQPSVNVVKPTMASASPSSTSAQKSNKSDSNTQTNLSVLHRSATPKHITASSESGKSSPRLGGDQSPNLNASRSSNSSASPASPAMSKKSSKSGSNTPDRTLDSPGTGSSSREGAMKKCATPEKELESPRSKSSSKENLLGDGSESDSLGRVSNKELPGSGVEKSLTPSNTSSPKLGVKMLGSHIAKNASNVAVVQPRPGEKMETTFDAEVRTETIHKMSSEQEKAQTGGKETTFLTPEKEEKTTFLDDQGETMDIKPMPPIMRALPYGYFRGYSGYGGFNNRNFHIPGISVPTTAMYATRTGSAQGLGMPPRPLGESSQHGGPPKFYSAHIKRAGSASSGPHGPPPPHSSSSDADYASESDTYDYVSGYMSDGDILKNNRNNGGGGAGADDWSSGYLSEGGASLYARRLQQRFREGMQAVRECMQKSSGIMDDDSFDDSSSISSGEISDTIAEISTDENLTGSSQGALSDNPYNSLKRTPKDILSIHAGYGTNGGSSGHPPPLGHPPPPPGYAGKRVPTLGTSAFMGTDYNSDSGIGSGWGRKYSLTQAGKFLSNDPNKLLSSDPSDYGYGYGWPSSRSEGGYSSLRKMSNGSNPDYAYYSEGDYDSPHRSFSPAPGVGGMKKDTETNTDQSHLLEASMRRLNTSGTRSGNATPPGSNGAGTQFGYRRSLSNASNSSAGSSSKNGGGSSKSSSHGSSAVGSRLAKHGVDTGQRSVHDIPRPASAAGKPINPDMALVEGYNSSTLDRKKKNGGLTPSKSTGCTQTDRDFQSSSLGRRRLFGSKGNLNKSQGDSPSPVGGTIISNPHATYSRGGEKPSSHYVNLQELHARIPGSNYVPLEFASSPRNSSLGSPAALGPGSMWLKSSHSSNGVGLPPGPPPSHSPHPFHAHAMSDSETFESLAHPHIQAQIQQARALTNARMMAHHADMTPPPLPGSSPSASQALQRSNSIKSDSAYPRTKHSSFSEDLPRTGSFSQLASPQGPHTVPASPTLSQSSRFTYPMAYAPPNAVGAGPNMVRSSTQSSLPFSALGKRASRDEDESRKSTLNERRFLFPFLPSVSPSFFDSFPVLLASLYSFCFGSFLHSTKSWLLLTNERF